jgi:hypothetical protein
MTAAETVIARTGFSVSAMIIGSGKAWVWPSSKARRRLRPPAPDDEIARSPPACQRLAVLAPQPVLVAADTLESFSSAASKGHVRVAADTVGGQLLTGRQGDGAIDLEGRALSTDDHVGAAAVPVEVLQDA